VSTMTLVSPPSPVLAGRARHRLFRLGAEAPAARAADMVRAAITQWQVPADRALAAALASDLVIHAALHGTGEGLTLSARWAGCRFRVEVRDPSLRGDEQPVADVPGRGRRGLLLAAEQAADSGCYQAPAGRAVYYVLEAMPSDAATGGGQARGTEGGDGALHSPVRTVPAPPAGSAPAREGKPPAYVLPQRALEAVRHQLDEGKIDVILAAGGPLSAADRLALQDGLRRWGEQFDAARARMTAITARLARLPASCAR
jgi:hypothetical protein